MTLAERMLGLVVGPPQGRPPKRLPTSPHPASSPAHVAVLVGPADASAAAAAVALALARGTRQSCALAVSWCASGEDLVPAGALPAATGLSRRLCQSGFDAIAAGRLVRIRLQGPSRNAIPGWRALTREGVPMAIAIAGPRCDELDGELRRVERIIVAGAPESPGGLLKAAEADARSVGPPVTTVSMPLGPAARGLLALGYGAPPRISRAVGQALH